MGPGNEGRGRSSVVVPAPPAADLAKATARRRRRSVIVRSALEVAASEEAEIPTIGTLNEGALHAQLKNWYQRPGDRIEQVVGGFVVDLVRGDLLVEIQTGGFAPLRRKLGLLTRQHRVRLVAPLPLVRKIIRLSDEGELLSVRCSPRHGRVEDIFNRLVSIPSLLCRSHFELEVLLTHQDELRVYRHGRASRRHGWVVAGRRLVSVDQCLRISGPEDAACLLPPSLPELFDTAQLAEAAAIERRTAQQMTYCLRAMGVLHRTGKRGNAIVHRRTDATQSPQGTSHRLEPPNLASSTATETRGVHELSPAP
jgi:hypothetical protein